MSSHRKVLGSVHYKPSGMTWDEYNTIRNEWYDLLKNLGFNDIEHFERDGKGQASTLFTKSQASTSFSGSSTTVSANYKPDVEEYYRLCGLFLNHADWNKLFGAKANLYHYIFSLHSEGIQYRDIAKETHKDSWPFKNDTNHSVFWSHWHCKKIIKAMFAWKSTPEFKKLTAIED